MIYYSERILIKGRVRKFLVRLWFMEAPSASIQTLLLLPAMICGNKYEALPAREDDLSLESKAFINSHKNVLDNPA